MEIIIKIETEVNGILIVVYCKTYSGGTDEEIRESEDFAIRDIVSKLIGMSHFKIDEDINYKWSYEEFDMEKHHDINAMDLNDVYEPVFKHS